MKKLFLFLAVASLTAFTSCSSDDDSSGPAIDPNAATGVILSSNVETVQVGETFTFVLTDNKNNIVTTSADTKFYANDVVLTSPTFTPEAAGSFTIRATYKNVNGLELGSNEIVVVVTPAPLPSAYAMKYNGTDVAVTSGDMIYWGAYYTDDTQTDIVEIFALATHDGDLSAANPDNYAFVDFTMPVVDNQGNDVVAGSYNWVSPFTGLREIQLNLSGEVVAIDQTSYSAVTVNIENIEIAAGGTLTMKYSTTAAWGTSTLNTSGEGAGAIYDASQGKPSQKKVFNLAAFNAQKAQFFASSVKKLKK